MDKRIINVTAIYVYGLSDPSNYRPISLLSVFNRIFEKMMYYRLKSFLEQHNILHDSQYGFREKRSTEHALLDIINQIETNRHGCRIVLMRDF